MNAIKQIRQALGLSQGAMAKELGCTQGSISFYEVGKNDPTPDTAREIIAFARKRGLAIGFDHVYGAAEVPQLTPAPADASAPIAAGG